MIDFKFDKLALKGDFFGGLTAGIVALPLALAFGVQSGMGAIYGLYGAMILGLFAAIFGGTPTQISGPTGPMTVVATAVIMFGQSEASGGAGMGIIIGSFLLSGLFQIVLGLVGVGKYIKFIPYPVLSGFMSGIGLIIIFFQLFPAVGMSSPKSIVQVVVSIPQMLTGANLAAVALTLLTIAVIYIVPKISKVIPAALAGLIVASLASYLLGLNVPKIGEIAGGLPDLMLGELGGITGEHIMLVVQYGATLAVLGAIDSLLTSVVADKITRTKHNSRQELIGQGIGNMLAACFGGLPGAGATMRTVVNVNTGGRTKISGVVHALVLAAMVFGAGPLAAEIPLAVLAGVLITVGISIIDYKGIKHLLRVPREDAAVMVIVLSMTVFVDLLYAVGTGVMAACFLFMKKSSEVGERGGNVNPVQQLKLIKSMGLPQTDEAMDSVYIHYFDGIIFFGIISQLEAIGQNNPQISQVVLKMNRVAHIDQSGAYALIETIERLNEKGIEVMIVGLRNQPEKLLNDIAIVPNLIPENRVFPRDEECGDWIKSRLT